MKNSQFSKKFNGDALYKNVAVGTDGGSDFGWKKEAAYKQERQLWAIKNNRMSAKILQAFSRWTDDKVESMFRENNSPDISERENMIEIGVYNTLKTRVKTKPSS